MIWYFLIPFRGTTSPPRLSQDHILRKIFYRHGILTAQYWLPAMLFSCAVAAALAYPTVFLAGNPTAGFTSKPHQIWAAARAVEDVAVDIEMRQIWVHSSYMKALDKDVLQSALRIQQSIVGDVLAFPRSDIISSGFHSPLMYWNNSAAAIEADTNIIKTINNQSRSSSSLEVLLRPASVFAGKIFTRSKLTAADALVMTLMNRVEDNIGLRWQQKMHSLGNAVCPDCKLYPPHGEVSRSWLYEFTFTPVTFRENVTLAVLYGCIALYVLISLQRLKAFHSRFGLVVTAITQMIMSILASFTICGILKVNLVAVPQNAYPFVLLVIGVENMFRLINAILAYPPTMATDFRIANALGDVGPLSIATAAQNLLILWLLSLVVSPGIVAFCAFAAIATLVDTFFLLTFFVAVLNVDIRRLELQDSIARSKDQRQRSPIPQRSWFDALLQGRLPLSTRMAGSIVTTTFILTLNFYFFERTEQKLSLRRLLGFTENGAGIDFDTFAPPPMNATLTPGEWVRMQDFDTAREVLRLVNKGAQSFVIRVFTPLVVVLADADRTGTSEEIKHWSEDFREFTLHHIYPFVVVVSFFVTFVAVLMNFLLWNDAPEISELPEKEEEEAISIQHIHTCHKLDIIRMHSSGNGYLVTVGIDRSVNIVEPDRDQGGYLSNPLSSELASILRFRPILRVVIDTSGRYLAFQTTEETVIICDRKTNEVLMNARYEDLDVVVFQFFLTANKQLAFALLTSNGQLRIIKMEETTVYNTTIAGRFEPDAIVLDSASSRLIHLVRSLDNTEIPAIKVYAIETSGVEETQSIVLNTEAKESNGAAQSGKMHKLVQSHDSNILACTGGQHFLFDAKSMHCVKVSSAAITDKQTISVMSDSENVDQRALILLSQKQDSDDLTLQRIRTHSTDKPKQTDSSNFDQGQIINRPGYWLALPSHVVLGVRRKPQSQSDQLSSSVRSRHKKKTSFQNDDEDVRWEAYAATCDGEIATTNFSSVVPDVLDGIETPLFVTKAGPGAVLEDYSMAVAIGNMLKIVSISKTSLSLPPNLHGIERHSSTNRRRGGIRKMQ